MINGCKGLCQSTRLFVSRTLNMILLDHSLREYHLKLIEKVGDE